MAAKPTKHWSRVDAELSSEGLDDCSMELWPVLDTQHDVRVDADMLSEGQGDIVMDGLPSLHSQDSYGMDSAPLLEGLDFNMSLPPPPGAPEHDVMDVPQPFEKTLTAEEDVIVGLPEPIKCCWCIIGCLQPSSAFLQRNHGPIHDHWQYSSAASMGPCKGISSTS